MIRTYTTILGLLKNPTRWTTGSNAVTSKRRGKWCGEFDPKATAFCLNGAALRVYGKPKSKTSVRAVKTKAYTVAINKIKAAIGTNSNSGVISWNDHYQRRHKDVLKVLRKAKV